MTFIRDIGVRSHLIAVLPPPCRGTAVLVVERRWQRPLTVVTVLPASLRAHSAWASRLLGTNVRNPWEPQGGAASCWGRSGGPQAVPLQSHCNSPCGLSPTCSHGPAPAGGTRAPGIPTWESHSFSRGLPSPASFSHADTPAEGHREVLPGGRSSGAPTARGVRRAPAVPPPHSVTVSYLPPAPPSLSTPPSCLPRSSLNSRLPWRCSALPRDRQLLSA